MRQRFGYILIALLPALLAACTSAPVVQSVATADRQADAEAAAARGDFATAQDLYQTLVRDAQGDARGRLQIRLAEVQIELGTPEAALATLDALPPSLPTALGADAEGVRGDALFALGRPVDAVRVLVDREIWLDNSADVLANQARILDGLSRPESQAAARTTTGDPIVDGWLALAPLTRLADDGPAFRAALLDWHARFRDHPAAAGILAERLAATRTPGTVPGRLALLLPLDDPQFGLQARAVRDGFMAAHLASGHADRTAIAIYDTIQRGGSASYEAAQVEGADFIVGPLLPADVSDVQAQAGFVGTLALNVSSAPTARAATNFFQFALSSEDEVEAIATRAIAEGHETAAILYASDSDNRGFRLMNRFREAFQARGGRVVSTATYIPGGDLSAPVEDLLNVTQSEQRRARLARDLGRAIEFEPRRRGDIDMIFLQGDDTDARILVPLLAAYNAGGIPTYATRDVYDPTRAGNDADLDGLIFPDLPLLLRPIGEAETASRLLSEFTSESAELYPRFFAFGFDAYKLSESLYSGRASSWPLEGATGELYLGSDGRIRRVLPFAEFEGGRPRATDTPTRLLGAR